MANAGANAIVPTLRKLCMFSLIRNRQYLGDLGDIDGVSVRDILGHCSVEELARIEDYTRDGVSQRDLSWYTWHLWYKHYLEKLGMPPKEIQVLPLPGKPPGDYTPPITDAPEGDWRLMMEERQQEIDEKHAKLSGKLRGLYRAEQQLRDSRKVEVCLIKPPGRRRRVEGGPWAGPLSAPGPRAATISGHCTKGKMLKGIGLASSQARSIKTTTLQQGSRSGSSTMWNGSSHTNGGAARSLVTPLQQKQQQQHQKPSAPIAPAAGGAAAARRAAAALQAAMTPSKPAATPAAAAAGSNRPLAAASSAASPGRPSGSIPQGRPGSASNSAARPCASSGPMLHKREGTLPVKPTAVRSPLPASLPASSAAAREPAAVGRDAKSPVLPTKVASGYANKVQGAVGFGCFNRSTALTPGKQEPGSKPPAAAAAAKAARTGMFAAPKSAGATAAGKGAAAQEATRQSLAAAYRQQQGAGGAPAEGAVACAGMKRQADQQLTAQQPAQRPRQADKRPAAPAASYSSTGSNGSARSSLTSGTNFAERKALLDAVMTSQQAPQERQRAAAEAAVQLRRQQAAGASVLAVDFNDTVY